MNSNVSRPNFYELVSKSRDGEIILLTCPECGHTDDAQCFDAGCAEHGNVFCNQCHTEISFDDAHVLAIVKWGGPRRPDPRPGDHLPDMPRIPHSPNATDDSRFTHSVRRCEEEPNCVVLTKHWPKDRPNADGDCCDDIHIDADRVPEIVAAMLEHAPASITTDLLPELRRLLEALRNEEFPPFTIAELGIRAIDARDPSIITEALK